MVLSPSHSPGSCLLLFKGSWLRLWHLTSSFFVRQSAYSGLLLLLTAAWATAAAETEVQGGYSTVMSSGVREGESECRGEEGEASRFRVNKLEAGRD